MVDISSIQNIPDIWDLTWRLGDTLNFIDIIKGFVPLSLFDKVQSIVKQQKMTSLIISIFMDSIYTNIRDRVWKPRCDAQIEIEKGMGIDNRKKKQKNTSNIRYPNLDLDRTIYNSSMSNDQKGILGNIRLGGSWTGFIRWVNQLVRSFRVTVACP